MLLRCLFLLIPLAFSEACERAVATDEVNSRPNILLAITDDQSWMHAGAYGDKATETPAFDRVAREGVLFHYAYCAAPSCAPSRAALLTGRYIWELEEGGVLFGILQPKFNVFTHGLEDAGYQTAATGKTWGPGRLGEGWDRPLFQKQYNRRKLAHRRPGRSSNDYAANFADFLEQRDKGKPFLFWLGTSEPHQSYDVGAWKEAGKELEQACLPGCLPDHPVTRGEILDYGLEIEHFDRHLGRVLKLLEEAGELDNTLILVTSDHGNPLPRSKCNLYDSGTRVPLAVRLPERIPGGRTVDDFVSLVDVAPTLLDLADVDIPKEISGRSLWPVLASQSSGRVDAERDMVVTAFERHIICRRDGVGYPMRGIRTHRWAYIRNYEPARWPAGDPDFNSSHQGFYGDVDHGASKRLMIDQADDARVRPYFLRAFGRRPAEELYDMQADPHQLRNLAEVEAHAAIKRELRARLQEFLKRQGDPRQRGETPWDEYPFTDQRIFQNPNWRTDGFASPLPE